MNKKEKAIPLNAMTDLDRIGISIDRISFEKSDFKHSHRDEGYTFHMVEKGTVHIEIDFNRFEIRAPSLVYMHPSQVHRILHFEHITICSLSVKDENLNPEYLTLLDQLAPTKPLYLEEKTNSTFLAIFDLCLNFSTQSNNRLHYSLLKDSCNTLVAFMISQFLGKDKTQGSLSRFESMAKAFKELLEKNYRICKSPGRYAEKLNISTAYLNECIHHTTGFSVSQHIRERIILEAKRLLYHTDKSVKEISFELGYDDYPYFSRIFKKSTGMSPLAFRNKNRD